MVTFLVCLVVVGGALAAILVVTLHSATEQPDTEDGRGDRRARLRVLAGKASAYLVPVGAPTAPHPALAGATTSSPAEPEQEVRPAPMPEPEPEPEPEVGPAPMSEPEPEPALEAPEPRARPSGIAWSVEPQRGGTPPPRPSRSRRALRRLRSSVTLVVLLVGLGAVLALSLVGIGALLAIGVRAALGA